MHERLSAVIPGVAGLTAALVAGLVVVTFALPARADETPRPPLGVNEVELRLGNGVFGRLTPPSGWAPGTGIGNERCWNAKAADGRLCVKSSWLRGRTITEVLEESVSGITCVEKTDTHSTDGDDAVSTLRRSCVVRIGARREGRLWIVSHHRDAQDAVMISVHLTRNDESFTAPIMKTLDDFKFYAPPAKRPPPADPPPVTPAPAKPDSPPKVRPGKRPGGG